MISIALFVIASILMVSFVFSVTTGGYPNVITIPGKIATWILVLPAGTFIVGLLSTLIITLVGFVWWVPMDYRPTETRDLQAITMNGSVHGSFFLGTGTVDDEQSYIFYYKTNGGFRTDSVPADNVLIVEDNSNPRVITITSFFPSWLMYGPFREWDDSYEIHVPSGSVKPMINMNLPGSN